MKANRIYLLIFLICLVLSLVVTFTNFLPFRLGLDLVGGSVLIYQADLSGVKQQFRDETLSGVKDLIERRVNILGISEVNVSYSKSGKLVVEIPNIKDPKEAIAIIGETPLLEFRLPKLIGTTTEFIPSELTGKYLKRAEVQIDQNTIEPYVLLEFDSAGRKLFENLTRTYLKQPIAIYIDGLPISAPIVQDVITDGKARITGRFTLAEAKTLAQRLNQGALPVPLQLVSQSTVSPSLGQVFLQSAIKGGIIGSILVILFMLFYYRFLGLVAVIALFFYFFFNLAVYKLIGVTLTLSGIAGLVLSVGMAVDANILIFARTKEELQRGHKSLEAIKLGFQRAWPSIRDSNITTIIATTVMYLLATSFVKGFALTLGLGVIISMMTAVFLSKTLIYELSPIILKQR